MTGAAVFVHGIFSEPGVWRPLLDQLTTDPVIGKAYTFPEFGYSSPKIQLNPKRRRPDLDGLASWLRTFLEHQCRDYEPIVLIGHSQGGLVIQRYLARMLADGRGAELRRIRSVILLACPNDGSDLLLGPRRWLLRRNVQELQLRPNSEPVKEAQARVLRDVVYSQEYSDTSCHILFHVFYGTEDNVVPVASARGPFAEARGLPGDHSTILAATTPDSPIVVVLRNLLRAALEHPAAKAPEPRQPAGPPVDHTGVIVVGSIPAEPPAFVTRDAADQLSRVLADARVAVVCALTGTRGVGKSQLAAAYARSRTVSGNGFVAWVNAENTGELLAGLAELAERLGVADPEGDSATSARRLRTHLAEGRAEGLLILDSATDRDVLRRYLPTTGRTQVVITSTDRQVVLHGTPVEVGGFDRPQSVRYLTERTGLDDPSGAATVAAALTDLPLALASAAATITERGLTYHGYRDRLRDVPLERVLTADAGDYPRPVVQSLLLAADTVRDKDPTGLIDRILQVMSVLSPHGVARELLHGLADHEGDTDPVDAALGQCVRGSVLSWSVDGAEVIMHGLIARVLREHAAEQGEFDAVLAAALDLLEPLLFDESQAWQRRESGSRLVSQLEAVRDSGAISVADRELAERCVRALNWAVRQLDLTADLSRAIDLGGHVNADSARILGPDHPDTLISRNNLAYAYESAGRLAEAIPLYEATLTDRVRVLGPDHPDTLTSRNNLANAYRSAGRLDEAIPLYEATLTDSVRVLGPDHPDTLISRNNLAIAYESAGRLDDAIPLYEATLTDSVRVLGPDHPDTLISRNNLAIAYRSAGRLADAIPLHEATLTDSVRVLGPDHPNTLTSRNNLKRARG